ncbi:chemotaxis protein CheW [Candidatus Epulonipiscium viviparus]|uniref:chemotaxis protein CheW n=1 Tax=Candidatus Epulonipiscium viviparus TaxID=420336 RepID=UPI00016C0EF5|nr:chemotaxis protein CheW [Candidatus Epulopiscium viviparus]
MKQYVVFEMDKQNFGIDIQSVQIIERMKSIMRVPKSPIAIRGVMNLRGEIIPVIDIRKLFNMDIVPSTDATRIIILKMEEAMVGCIVDKVKEVLDIDDDQVESTSSMQGKVDSSYIIGVGKVESGDEIVTLLNHERLVEVSFGIGE